MNEIVSLILAAVCLAGGGALVFYISSRFTIQAEWKRKMLHIWSGMVACAFPFLFSEAWPVLILTAAGVAGLIGIRVFSILGEKTKNLIAGVKRRSLGEFWLPVGVAVLFLLSGKNRVLYEIPLLILTFADAVAALIGVSYGKMPYEGTEGKKSWEGSISFFLTAFLVSLIVLLLWTGTGRAETVLISSLLGLFLMIVEAVSWDGLDNLFIPVCGFFLLRTWLPMSEKDLSLRLLVLGILTIAMFLAKRFSTFNTGAILGSILTGYLFWFLGGWQGLLFPLIFLLVFLFFPPGPWDHVEKQDQDLASTEQDGFFSILSTCGPGLGLLLYSAFVNPRDSQDILYLFMACFGMQLGIVLLFRLRRLSPITAYGFHFFLVCATLAAYLEIGFWAAAGTNPTPIPGVTELFAVNIVPVLLLALFIAGASAWFEVRSRGPHGFGFPGRWGWHFILGLISFAITPLLWVLGADLTVLIAG